MTRLLCLFLLSGLVFRAHAAEASLSVLVKTAQGTLLPDAVVSFVPLDQTPILPPPATAPVEIAQIDREYVPYVTPVLVGTQVDFPNRDSIQHHLYSLSKAKRFEKPLYASGARESLVFDKPGVVTLGCNIHDWMVAYIVVLETPYFTKTDDEGRATLARPPAGRGRLEVWHPRLAAPLVREIVLTADAPATEEFVVTLKPDRRLRRAPENQSKAY